MSKLYFEQNRCQDNSSPPVTYSKSVVSIRHISAKYLGGLLVCIFDSTSLILKRWEIVFSVSILSLPMFML